MCDAEVRVGDVYSPPGAPGVRWEVVGPPGGGWVRVRQVAGQGADGDVLPMEVWRLEQMVRVRRGHCYPP